MYLQNCGWLLIFLLSLLPMAYAQDNDQPDDPAALQQLQNEYDQELLKSHIAQLKRHREYGELYNKQVDFITSHRQTTFEWQYYQGIVVFVLVITLVLCGLYLSYRQFEHDLKTGAEAKTTTAKISKAGFEISSSVIGLIILVVSLGFFYLYIERVYVIEIEHLNFPSAESNQPASSETGAPATE
ncbi:MAG: hypothetical protein KDK04_09885 [Candidatus Competibacteraceae bacterium]|nr:hypothetical protein [Candidatus Competibacteraceae bacterium]MCB1812013.1 hypothetical protein [Candidatus Competibacteraceae bacterium]